MKKTDVYRVVLKIAKEIAKKKQGTLFVIADKKKFKGTYSAMYPQIMKEEKIDKPGINRVIEKLASLDGAVLISDKGTMLAYGTRLKKSRPIYGHGTRHAAAAGITHYIKGATAVLVSEEVGWIRIFKAGKIIIETDASKMPENVEKKVASYMSTGDKTVLAALAGGAGVAALIGAPIIAPIVIVGGTYLAVKTAAGMIKRRIKTRR